MAIIAIIAKKPTYSPIYREKHKLWAELLRVSKKMRNFAAGLAIDRPIQTQLI